MKKLRLSVMFILFGIMITACGKETAKTHDQYAYYEFPVHLFDDSDVDWVYQKQEIMESLQIPDEVQKWITTDNLIDLVMSYPYLFEFYAYGRLEDDFAEYQRRFNGVDILLKREDAFDKLLERYQMYEIPEELLIDDSKVLEGTSYNSFNEWVADPANEELIHEDASVIRDPDLMEILLLNLVGEDANRAEKFVDTYIGKLQEKQESSYYQKTSYGGYHSPTSVMEMCERTYEYEDIYELYLKKLKAQ